MDLRAYDKEQTRKTKLACSKQGTAICGIIFYLTSTMINPIVWYFIIEVLPILHFNTLIALISISGTKIPLRLVWFATSLPQWLTSCGKSFYYKLCNSRFTHNYVFIEFALLVPDPTGVLKHKDEGDSRTRLHLVPK